MYNPTIHSSDQKSLDYLIGLILTLWFSELQDQLFMQGLPITSSNKLYKKNQRSKLGKYDSNYMTQALSNKE